MGQENLTPDDEFLLQLELALIVRQLADELEAEDRNAWRYLRKEHAGAYEPRESVKLAREMLKKLGGP